MAFMMCLQSGDFYKDLHANKPRTMLELWVRAQRWMEKEEASDAKRRCE